MSTFKVEAVDCPRVEVEVVPTDPMDYVRDTFREDYVRSTDIRKRLFLLTNSAYEALQGALEVETTEVEDMVKIGKLALEVLRENVMKYPTFSVQQHLSAPQRERPKDILVSREEMIDVTREAVKAEGAMNDVKRIAAERSSSEDAAGVSEVL